MAVKNVYLDDQSARWEAERRASRAASEAETARNIAAMQDMAKLTRGIADALAVRDRDLSD